MHDVTITLCNTLLLQDAFWAMVILIGTPRYAMHGMFIPGLPKLLASCDLHGQVRRRYLPKLDRHFVSSI